MRCFHELVMAGAILALCTAAIPAQQGAPVTVTVTVSSKDQTQPQIPANEVIVHQDGKVRPVISWMPAKGDHAGLDLAIVVDDSITTRVADRWSDLQGFVRSLPAETRVAIVYANYGGTRFEQNFTADHEAAAKAFRIPSALPGATNGIYDAVRDFVKKWPATHNRREILLISSGIDLDNGVVDTQPGVSQTLQRAVDEAERSGIVFYTIYASAAGEAEHNSFLVINGQGCLGRLSAETGGDSFFQGLNTPVSFQPYLDEIRRHLGDQYLLTFGAEPKGKAEVSRLKVETERRSVQLIAPDHVFVPGGN